MLVSSDRLRRLAWASSFGKGGHPVVIDEVASADAARALLAPSGPAGLVLFDARVVEDPADAVAAVLQAPDTSRAARVVVVGPVDRVEQVQRALKTGAGGYLFGSPRPTPASVVAPNGGHGATARVDPDADGHVVLNDATGVRCRLSRREVSVLRHVADGESNVVIAHALGLSTYTVKSHLARIGRRLGTGDRGHMVYLAMRAGVID